MDLRVVVEDYDGRLAERAERAWDDFIAAVTPPIALSVRRPFDYCDKRQGAMAGTWPCLDENRADMFLSTDLMKSTDQQIRLTLLHECIDLRLAFQEHRQHWKRVIERERLRDEQAKQFPGDLGRLRMASLFEKHPDEVRAEAFLHRHYQEWFADRAAYFVGMRQTRLKDLSASQSHTDVKAICCLYEHLACMTFSQLVGSDRSEHAELARIGAAQFELFTASTQDRTSAPDIYQR